MEMNMVNLQFMLDLMKMDSVDLNSDLNNQNQNLQNKTKKGGLFGFMNFMK